MTPSEQQIEQYQRTSSDTALGLFFLVALVLAIGAWSWMHSDSWLNPPQRISVLFHDVAGLHPRAAVLINGVRVGVVEKMKLHGPDDVLLMLRIQTEQVVLPQGSRFYVMPNGVVGAKHIEVELPHLALNQPSPPALNEQSYVRGVDPARPELEINRILANMGSVDFHELGSSMNQSMQRMSAAADEVSALSREFRPLARTAKVAANRVDMLASELSGATRKVNRLLSDPGIGSDIKETVRLASDTATKIDRALITVRETLEDSPSREALLETLTRLNTSTAHVQNSLYAVKDLSADKELRAEVGGLIANIHDTVSSINRMVSDPGLGNDMKGTLSQTRSAMESMERMAKQMSQVLDKRAPLVHMLIGRPGRLQETGRMSAESPRLPVQ